MQDVDINNSESDPTVAPDDRRIVAAYNPAQYLLVIVVRVDCQVVCRKNLQVNLPAAIPESQLTNYKSRTMFLCSCRFVSKAK